MTTATDRDVETTIRHLYEIFSGGDGSAADEVVTSDWHAFPTSVGNPGGPDGLRQIVAGLRSAFPDLKVTVEDVFASGDRAAVRLTMRGTQLGEFLGVEPTGREIEITANEVHEMRGDKVAVSWHVEDNLGALFQLGATVVGPDGE